jgi:hypothetical protein
MQLLASWMNVERDSRYHSVLGISRLPTMNFPLRRDQRL